MHFPNTYLGGHRGAAAEPMGAGHRGHPLRLDGYHPPPTPASRRRGIPARPEHRLHPPLHPLLYPPPARQALAQQGVNAHSGAGGGRDHQVLHRKGQADRVKRILVINIIFDPIFIFGFGMGVAGAAWATVLGQVVGAALGIYFNATRNTEITLTFKGFRPNASVRPESQFPACSPMPRTSPAVSGE